MKASLLYGALHLLYNRFGNSIVKVFSFLIIHSHHDRVSSIARVHASTWDYFAELFFTECLTGRFKRSPEVVGAEIMTDINDLVQEFWTSSLKSRLAATPHILMDYWWIFILLHRPFFDRKLRSIHIMDCEIDHVKVSNIFLIFLRESYTTFPTLVMSTCCRSCFGYAIYVARHQQTSLLPSHRRRKCLLCWHCLPSISFNYASQLRYLYYSERISTFLGTGYAGASIPSRNRVILELYHKHFSHPE